MDWSQRLGTGGLALAVVFGFLPYVVKDMPSWITWPGLAFGLLLFLIACFAKLDDIPLIALILVVLGVMLIVAGGAIYSERKPRTISDHGGSRDTVALAAAGTAPVRIERPPVRAETAPVRVERPPVTAEVAKVQTLSPKPSASDRYIYLKAQIEQFNALRDQYTKTCTEIKEAVLKSQDWMCLSPQYLKGSARLLREIDKMIAIDFSGETLFDLPSVVDANQLSDVAGSEMISNEGLRTNYKRFVGEFTRMSAKLSEFGQKYARLLAAAYNVLRDHNQSRS